MTTYLSAGIFSKGFWQTWGQRLLELFYTKSSLRYDFGLGAEDVRMVCKFYKDPVVFKTLEELSVKNKLKGESHFETVKNVMRWVNYTYPASAYYSRDKRETWNNPLVTLKSWQDRQKNKYTEVSTDCDDYAIFIYNTCRVLGVPAEDLYLCFMKTTSEWHLNVMFFDNGVPYAVEGTYFPSQAERNFGSKSYFENKKWDGTRWGYYYEFILWIFNESVVRKNSRKVLP